MKFLLSLTRSQGFLTPMILERGSHGKICSPAGCGEFSAVASCETQGLLSAHEFSHRNPNRYWQGGLSPANQPRAIGPSRDRGGGEKDAKKKRATRVRGEDMGPRRFHVPWHLSKGRTPWGPSILSPIAIHAAMVLGRSLGAVLRLWVSNSASRHVKTQQPTQGQALRCRVE